MYLQRKVMKTMACLSNSHFWRGIKKITAVINSEKAEKAIIMSPSYPEVNMIIV